MWMSDVSLRILKSLHIQGRKDSSTQAPREHALQAIKASATIDVCIVLSDIHLLFQSLKTQLCKPCLRHMHGMMSYGHRKYRRRAKQEYWTFLQPLEALIVLPMGSTCGLKEQCGYCLGVQSRDCVRKP